MTEIQELKREIQTLKVKQGQQHRDLHKLMREINIIRSIMKKEKNR